MQPPEAGPLRCSPPVPCVMRSRSARSAWPYSPPTRQKSLARPGEAPQDVTRDLLRSFARQWEYSAVAAPVYLPKPYASRCSAPLLARLQDLHDAIIERCVDISGWRQMFTAAVWQLIHDPSDYAPVSPSAAKLAPQLVAWLQDFARAVSLK